MISDLQTDPGITGVSEARCQLILTQLVIAGLANQGPSLNDTAMIPAKSISAIKY
ncbi:hypothetical protein [Erwinia sp. ErVv1]|uniref:hypothetical protein n=1 Tax=Erwinia sp. ErVv1 TaxID=1603299 RepID=UPI0035182C83